MPVALTQIRHGNEDGTLTVVEQYQDVKGLPKDVVEGLKAQGLVGDLPEAPQALVEERDLLAQRVAELEQQLKDAHADREAQAKK
jgi:pheromone shutdown protein TraB